MAAPNVEVQGLKELRRDLRAVENALGRELTTTMRRAAEPVARVAAELAPRSTGALAQSIKAGAAGTRATIRSRLPYANVQAWGGTTGPGHKPGAAGSGSVKVRGTRFPEKAAVQKAESFLEDLAQGVDHLLSRHGFK